MAFSLFPRPPQAKNRSPQRGRSAGKRAAWETLGGLGSGLSAFEPLESRIALAADLATEFVEPAAYYVPGSPARYVVTVANLGTGNATDVAFSTTLASQFTSRTWTAVYTGGATGPRSGSGNVSTGNAIDLPMGGEARFTIDGIFTASATGNAVSAATATVAGEIDTLGNNTATNTREQAAQAITVTDDASLRSGATVRIIDPASGTQQLAFAAYGSDVRGVQAVLADLDSNGRPEIVTAPLRGGQGQIRVFAADGTELPQYRLQPFGPGWAGGLSIAVGDFDGDGLKDVAAAKATGDGEVRVFRGQAGGNSFAAAPYRTIRPFDSGFLGGASLAAADMGTFSAGVISDAAKQDGRHELILAGGPTAAPVVRIYDLSATTPAVVDTIRPFSPGFRGGVAVAPARINADGITDLIISAGRNGGSNVEVYDGRAGAGANPRLDAFAAFAGAGASRAATYATAIDTDGDGRADGIYSTQGAGGRGSLKQFDRDGVIVGSLASFTGPMRVAAPLVAPNAAFVTTASGLMYSDLVVGTGAAATANNSVEVTYRGTYLNDVSGRATIRDRLNPSAPPKTGTLVNRVAGEEFDSGTRTFAIQGLIAGWIEGIPGMKEGGRRQLVVPGNLAYGANGTGNYAPGTTDIPPNAALVFDIELVEIKSTP